ncbi:MAG: gamma carbonic anhydrase family protein [Pseudomonadota bacterium]
MISAIKGKSPNIDPSAFVAGNATVLGDVRIGAGAGIWFGAVIRGDSNSICVGSRTNVQDLCVLHVDELNPLRIGDDVTIGHRAILHGCSVGDRVLIGMGAIIMNGATIGDDSIVGAGALVTEGTKVLPRSLLIGVPAKVKRELSDGEIAGILQAAKHYVQNAAVYKKS